MFLICVVLFKHVALNFLYQTFKCTFLRLYNTNDTKKRRHLAETMTQSHSTSHSNGTTKHSHSNVIIKIGICIRIELRNLIRMQWYALIKRTELSDSLCLIDSLELFKSNLKTHILRPHL